MEKTYEKPIAMQVGYEVSEEIANDGLHSSGFDFEP